MIFLVILIKIIFLVLLVYDIDLITSKEITDKIALKSGFIK